MESANPVDVNITTSITFDDGYSMSNTGEEIGNKIKEYLAELRKKWADTSKTIVRVAQIENNILNVQGVIDIENTRLNNAEGNIVLEKNDIPVFGSVVNVDA